MEFNQHEPIYLQIVNYYKKQIAGGSLQPGEQIPSRRELALTLKINPNTVQKAYKLLEEEGIIQTIRNQGSIVTQDAAWISNKETEFVNEVVVKFVEGMKSMNYDKDQTFHLIEKIWEHTK